MNHYEEVLKIINGKQGVASMEQGYHVNMFRHFIEIMGEKDFNSVFEAYFINTENESFDNSFYGFHKSMRQCDFYDDYYMHIYGRNEQGKRTTDYENIGVHLDMLFWNFIQISETPYFILNLYYAEYQTYKELVPNIGKRVSKDKSDKPFKSGQKINTVRGLTIHPFLEVPAYTFIEDDSYVECRRCKIVDEENDNNKASL
jgi:hypothetical protein